MEALITSQTKKISNSFIDATGAVRNTPLQKVINIKIGAKIMLTYNIDTCDSLTNGSFGEVLGLESARDGSISRVIVQFYEEKCGREKRKKFSKYEAQYPGKNPTPIERIEFHYTLSRKSSTGVKNASIFQFPLKLAFAATAHKVQGQTVKNRTV